MQAFFKAGFSRYSPEPDWVILHQYTGFGAKAGILGNGPIAFTAFLKAVGAVITGSEGIHHPFFSKGAAHGCLIFHIWFHNHLRINSIA